MQRAASDSRLKGGLGHLDTDMRLQEQRDELRCAALSLSLGPCAFLWQDRTQTALQGHRAEPLPQSRILALCQVACKSAVSFVTNAIQC